MVVSYSRIASILLSMPLSDIYGMLYLLLQIWRMIDLIYRPEEDVLEELDKFKSHLQSCAP